MIVLLSPAKTLDFERALPPLAVTTPHFAEEAHGLAKSTANLSQKRLAELMHISPRLAKLNADRFRDFADLPERQALYAFAGDVYTGFEVDTLDEAAVAFAQDHVRMLSGLYGLLRPLDAIRPYRLEMGTRWAPRHKKLTDWWGDRIAALLRAQTEEEGSGWSSISPARNISRRREQAGGATRDPCRFPRTGTERPAVRKLQRQRARGMMARWMCEHHVADVDAMQGFDSDGYRFDPSESDADHWRFTRS
ncbi:YaaA family protein [Sphingobium scionense]